MAIVPYNGHDIPVDDRPFVNLTEMWRAADSPGNKDPGQWRRLPESDGFIGHIAAALNVGKSQVIRADRGRGGGTWAHRQVALAYAQYLSHASHVARQRGIPQPGVGAASRRRRRPAGVDPAVRADILRQTVFAQQQQSAVNLQIIDHLADQARQLESASARIDAIERRQEEATGELLALPGPTVPAPPATTRQRLVALVRAYCRGSGVHFPAAFGELYRQVCCRLRIDLAAQRRRRPDKEKPDLLEESGRIEEAYAIACELFPAGPLRAAEYSED